jgi:hypothetical protein
MAVKSFRSDGGVRFAASAAVGTAGTAANPVVWSDNTAQPNARFGDGTADRYVPAITPVAVGDVATWNGTNWIRSGGAGGNVTSLRFPSPRQTPTIAASLTIDPALGDWVRLLLNATVISSITISLGLDGEEMTLSIIQDATGSRAVPTTWTNVNFSGGTYVVTATALKRDLVKIKYDAGSTKWWEVSRALNQ